MIQPLLLQGSIVPLSYIIINLALFDYVYMNGHTYSKSMDQPGKVANPARGQRNSENAFFHVHVRA